MIQKIQAAVAGLTVEEIADQIRASQYAGSIEDVDTVAAFLAEIGKPEEPTPEQMAPEQAETEEASGND